MCLLNGLNVYCFFEKKEMCRKKTLMGVLFMILTYMYGARYRRSFGMKKKRR